MSKKMKEKMIKNTNTDVLWGLKHIKEAEQKLIKFNILDKKSKTLLWVMDAIQKDITIKGRAIENQKTYDAYKEVYEKFNDVVNQRVNVLEEMEAICY